MMKYTISPTQYLETTTASDSNVLRIRAVQTQLVVSSQFKAYLKLFNKRRIVTLSGITGPARETLRDTIKALFIDKFNKMNSLQSHISQIVDLEFEVLFPGESTAMSGSDVFAPLAPVLHGTMTSGSVAHLTWDALHDNVGIDHLNLYRGGVFYATIAADATYRNVTDTSGPVTRAFTLTAVDAAGNESAVSNTVSSVFTDVTAPTVPTGLTATITGSTTMTVHWTASTDNVAVDHYILFKDGVTMGNISGVTTNLTGLTAATAYTFKVRAVDAAGNMSAFTADVIGTTDA